MVALMSVHELEAVSLRPQRVPTLQRSAIVALANPDGGLENRNGQIQTLDDLTLRAGAGRIDNRQSLIRSARR